MRLIEYFQQFLQNPDAINNKRLSSLVYERLPGYRPRVKVVHIRDQIYPFTTTQQLGEYNIFTNTCLIKQLDTPHYMITVLGHELCHAQARKILISQQEEMRVELFELAFSRYLEEHLNEPFTLPLNGKSKLIPFEDYLGQRSSHELLSMHQNIQKTCSDFGISWMTRFTPNL